MLWGSHGPNTTPEQFITVTSPLPHRYFAINNCYEVMGLSCLRVLVELRQRLCRQRAHRLLHMRLVRDDLEDARDSRAGHAHMFCTSQGWGQQP
jgi:hypothetical protein